MFYQQRKEMLQDFPKLMGDGNYPLLKNRKNGCVAFVIIDESEILLACSNRTLTEVIVAQHTGISQDTGSTMVRILKSKGHRYDIIGTLFPRTRQTHIKRVENFWIF